jgi:hypothetical protein
MTDLTWQEIQVFLPAAKELRVSEVARSPGQIVEQFQRFRSVDNLPPKWQQKRRGFIARHMAQYQKNPTYRRFLALAVWGYLPETYPEEIMEVL